MDQINGRAWTFGDNIDTDLLAPGHAMKKPLEQLATHCLEAIEPGFASSIQRGDVVVAGRGFGIGSSREQAAQALLFLGVGAVLAKSLARIFYRNCLNIGLPVLVFPEADRIQRGDHLTVEPATGLVVNHTRGEEYRCEPIPAFLMDMLRDGGLIPHLHKRLHGTPTETT
jgi:3-isopropylmalate/(R)-2-methylmalate dehydratase small subunit